MTSSSTETEIDVRKARSGIVAYDTNFRRWLNKQWLPFGAIEEKHGLDQHLRRKSKQSGDSASDMWGRFDRTNMSLLCNGGDAYTHANLVVTAFYTWWDGPVDRSGAGGDSSEDESLDNDRDGDDGDAYARSSLPPECGVPCAPSGIGHCVDFVPWLASMDEKAFSHAAAWAEKAAADWRTNQERKSSPVPL
jgi:hypothetical protein